MSRDDASHRDDVMPDVGPLPLLLPPATDVAARVISGLSPFWLESVERYRRCQLFAAYAWRLLLSRTALRVTDDVDRPPLQNHDAIAATVSTIDEDDVVLNSVDRSSRRFHPYVVSHR